MFKHYYPDRFPSLWEKFDLLVYKNNIVSIREVANEIELREDRLSEWSKNNRSLFPVSSPEELLFVTEIFLIEHFQSLIRKKERLQGKPVADPFVIAKAKILKGCVVTQELWKENASKIPNICEYFSIPYLNLEGFMEKEGWEF